jgi:hypothetical protein
VGTPGYSRGTARVLACAAAAARPSVARAVLACAGAYVSGAAGSNECPAGAVRIEAEEACRTAAAAAGKTFSRVETSLAYPRGCYYVTGNTAFFNTHAVGAGFSSARLLCAAVVTTGARARVHWRVQCACAQRRLRMSQRHVHDCACVAAGRQWGERVVRRGIDGGALRCGHGAPQRPKPSTHECKCRRTRP